MYNLLILNLCLFSPFSCQRHDALFGCNFFLKNSFLIFLFSDTIAAAHFQMKEVFGGYRQSTDAGSKKRVRDASNAALQSLPDWPPAKGVL